MFVDRVKIFVKGGDGGRGCASFRRETFVPMGGPDGGNGGNGGDVILVGRVNQNTLLPLRFHTEFRAKRGSHGGPSNRTGRDAADTRIDVPLGTIVREAETDIAMGEVVEDGQELLIAKAGRGGRGNKSYLSNMNRAPRNADPGEAGEEHWLWLDLKLLADVGLVGLPNAGKSTLLSKISAAKPKIADYPFTTLTPVLGMASWDDYDFVVADVPGIIEGASTGSGLGLDFLRHIERTKVIVHVVDASGISGRDPIEDYKTICRELDAFSPALATRPRIIVASKRDLVNEDEDPLPSIRKLAKKEKLDLVEVSAATGKGLKELTRKLAGMLQSAREAT